MFHPFLHNVMNSRVFLPLVIIMMLVACATVSENPYLGESSSGRITWRSSEKTVSISRVSDDSAPYKGKGSLRVHGSIIKNTRFAESELSPLQEFTIYRLTVWIRFNAARHENLHPGLICQFVASDPRTSLGEIAVDSYDFSAMGTWQKVLKEFRAPLGTEQIRYILNSGNDLPATANSPRSIDAYIKILEIEPIQEYSKSGKYLLNPLPSSLDNVRGIHPRIYLTKERIAELRTLIKTTHAHLWEEIRKQADDICRIEPPTYMDEDQWSNIEQLYMRSVGNNIPFLAMAYVLSDDRKYLDAGKKWALAACGYKTWGLYEFGGIDLAASHQLFGLGILYDWCYDALDEETKRTIRETIIQRGSYMFNAAASGRMVKDIEVYRHHPWTQWDEAYLQNHLWDNSCGLSVAGLSVFDEYDDATQWLGFTLDKFQTTMKLLGDDGSSHEGVPYWTYGIEYLLKFMELSRTLLDVDMYDNNWFRATAMYRLYMGLPKNSWSNSNTVVNYGDSPRYDWYGPDYQLRRLASEYKDGYAQWLAQEIDEQHAEHAVAGWLNLLWYDPKVMAKPPYDLPTIHHFEDIGIVTARTDWSGDESLLFFKCGPYIGHKAIQQMVYDHATGHHVHPDANNFMLFGYGEWLIRDDGYWSKHTRYHNTLIIDNGEQLGGGDRSFSGLEPHSYQAHPRITRVQSTPEVDFISGDATEAYPKNTGLLHYRRHLIFMKPDVLIIIDDIKLNEEKELELDFHPEQQQAERDGNVFVIRGEKASLRIEPLTYEGISVTEKKIVTIPKEENDKDGDLYTISFNNKQSQWLQITALSWAHANETPMRIKMTEAGDTYTFFVGNRTVNFNKKTGDIVSTDF